MAKRENDTVRGEDIREEAAPAQPSAEQQQQDAEQQQRETEQKAEQEAQRVREEQAKLREEAAKEGGGDPALDKQDDLLRAASVNPDTGNA